MKQNVNYIEHHKNVNSKILELNLNSTHIALYNALFLIWNECGFDTDLSINRNDVMKLSKIGSANTYTKCLKELDEAKLIKYLPSFNPLIGSKINLYRFDNGSSKGTDKSSSKGTDNSTATLYKLLNKETIKLIEENYSLVNEKLSNWIVSTTRQKPNKKGNQEFSDAITDLYLKIYPLFDEKARPKNEKQANDWKECLLKCNEKDGYSLNEIYSLIYSARNDSFWKLNFISLLKLQKPNKEGVKYIDVFNIKFGKPKDVGKTNQLDVKVVPPTNQLIQKYKDPYAE